MQHSGYSQKQSMKIVRTTHRVTYHANCTAGDLVKWLSSVPAKARITDFSEGDSESGELPYIEFELETAVKKETDDGK